MRENDSEIMNTSSRHSPRTNPQGDLFAAEEQAELFDENAAPVVYHGDPDRVRARLHRLIAEARAANVVPWDLDSLRLYRRIVPQMSLWLPEDEGRQLVLQFEEELLRLKAA